MDNIVNFKKFDDIDWLNSHTGELIDNEEYCLRAQPAQILADEWIISPVEATA